MVVIALEQRRKMNDINSTAVASRPELAKLARDVDGVRAFVAPRVCIRSLVSPCRLWSDVSLCTCSRSASNSAQSGRATTNSTRSLLSADGKFCLGTCPSVEVPTKS